MKENVHLHSHQNSERGAKYWSILLLLLFFQAWKWLVRYRRRKRAGGRTYFEMVSVPTLITEPAERALLIFPNTIGTKFNFNPLISIIPLSRNRPWAIISMSWNMCSPIKRPPPSRRCSVKPKPTRAMFNSLTKLYEKYLYNANSPMHNDEFSTLFWNDHRCAKFIDDAHKIRVRAVSSLAMKQSGEEGETILFPYIMHRWDEKPRCMASRRIISFSLQQPDCEACIEMTCKRRILLRSTNCSTLHKWCFSPYIPMPISTSEVVWTVDAQVLDQCLR